MNQGAVQRKSKRQKIKKQFGRKWYNQRSKILDIKTSQKTVLNTFSSSLRILAWEGRKTLFEPYKFTILREEITISYPLCGHSLRKIIYLIL